MGIDLHWEDERGNLLENVDDPHNIFARFIIHAQLSQTVCLRFIDEYGNTVFNQLQIPTLVNELESFLKIHSNSESSEQISRVLNLARQSQGQPHTYLKFYGD